jgi:hypothetical protein
MRGFGVRWEMIASLPKISWSQVAAVRPVGKLPAACLLHLYSLKAATSVHRVKAAARRVAGRYGNIEHYNYLAGVKAAGAGTTS